MFLPDQYVACLFRKSLLIFFVLLFTASFIYVLLMFWRLFFVCNKTVYHRAMRNYHTSTLKNAINSVNYLHNRSPELIQFLDNFQLHRRTVRPIGFDNPPVKMFGHRNCNWSSLKYLMKIYFHILLELNLIFSCFQKVFS